MESLKNVKGISNTYMSTASAGTEYANGQAHSVHNSGGVSIKTEKYEKNEIKLEAPVYSLK
jgi:hypothetical protein